MTNAVMISTDEGVLQVAINRPERRNAVDRQAARQLYEAFVAFDRDDTLSIAVLTGTCGTFCAGADLHAIADGAGNEVTTPDAGDIMGSLGPMGPTRLELGKPVIAAVEGYAVAGGLELAIWADLRVAAVDSVFGVFCRRWGVPLIDGGTVRLPRLIGEGRAADLSLTGREVTADEAARIGLVDRVVPPGQALAAATQLAKEIATHPQQCLRADRRSARRNWGHPTSAALADEVAGSLPILAEGLASHGAEAFTQRSR